MRSVLFLALCALALTNAQEECAADVAAAVAPLNAKVQQTTAELTAANEQLASVKAQLTSSAAELASAKAGVASGATELTAVSAERDTLQQEVTGCKDGYAKVYANVGSLTAKLSTAEEQLSKAPEAHKLDIPTIATALAAIAKDGALSAVETGKAVFEELKQGKTDLLSKLVGSLLSTLRGAASSTVAFIKAEAEEHLPESVKTQISTYVSKATAFWKEHVTDAAWAQPVLKQLGSVNEELKKVVEKALSSTPALAPLADPVTVQLLAYAVFALPVVLLLVLPLALAGGKKPPAADARSGAGKGKKKGKGARA